MFDFSAMRTCGMRVLFEKKNGEIREMRCTTNPSSIPLDQRPNGRGKPHSPLLHRVYDLDEGDWRSFWEHCVREAEPLTPA